jgi:hypothetical protein
MSLVVIENIAFEPDWKSLLKTIHMDETSRYAKEFESLFHEALGIVKPKALYRVAYIDSKGEDHVGVEGIRLSSRVLRVNLENAHRVFAYTATCGREIEEWSNQFDNMLDRFWIDAVKECALRRAMEAMIQHIDDRYRPGPTSRMAPGSLEDWPITEQYALFELLGDPKKAIGVELNDSCLMIPVKSLSGICFPTEERFESCQLCPRKKCPGRRATYDPDLYDKKYATKEKEVS